MKGIAVDQRRWRPRDEVRNSILPGTVCEPLGSAQGAVAKDGLRH